MELEARVIIAAYTYIAPVVGVATAGVAGTGASLTLQSALVSKSQVPISAGTDLWYIKTYGYPQTMTKSLIESDVFALLDAPKLNNLLVELVMFV